MSNVLPTECPLAPTTPADRRPDKTRLSIAQFNADWLFLARGTSKGTIVSCPRPDNSSASSKPYCAWTATAAEAHVRAVALELLRLDVDVVHLAEVEDCFVLKQLLAQLPHGHGYMPYMIFGNDTALGQNVALISRIDPIGDLTRVELRGPYPLSDSRCGWSKTGSRGLSKHLVARFNVPGLPNGAPLTLIGAHLLSQIGRESACAKREAQATVLACVARDATKRGDHVVLLGDFNDFDDDATDVNVANFPSRSDVLRILKNSTQPPLFNTALRVAASERYSKWWDKNKDCRVDADNGELQLLDHVLVSHALAIKHLESVEMRHDWAAGCQTQGVYESDHWPIKITFTGLEQNVEHAISSPILAYLKVILLACLLIATVVCARRGLKDFGSRKNAQRRSAETEIGDGIDLNERICS